MIIWFLRCIIDVLFNLICYITNPIVVLFANEVGELPPILVWWANWDDGLDVEWMITEHRVPKWAEYDFNRHYKYYSEWEAEEITGQHKGFVELLDPHFTLKERFQRYICRLVWIYRNCAYGFSYHVTGADIDGARVITKADCGTDKEPYYIAHYKNWLLDPFCIFIGKGWCTSNISWLKWTGINKRFYLKIFLGYKFQHIQPNKKERAMLALFAWPFKSYEEEMS